MKKLLYIFDNINYQSGARNVMLYQMACFYKDYDIHVFSFVEPREDIKKLKNMKYIGEDIWKQGEIYGISLVEVIYSSRYSIFVKLKRILYSLKQRIGWNREGIQNESCKKLIKEFEHMDFIVIVSEASKLRHLVASLKHPKKIQWIHTDYARWSEFSSWTKAVTKKDNKLYQNFDALVVLSEQCKRGIIQKMPDLISKIRVIPNLIQGDIIRKKADEEGGYLVDAKKINLVTVGRMDKEKGLEKGLEYASYLKEENSLFHWYLVGDGPLKDMLQDETKKRELTDEITFTGNLSNPYPLMKQCDVLVLLSHYEGTPVTIDEAFVLGIPVIAPAVGGITEQMERIPNGILLKGEDGYKKFRSGVKKKEGTFEGNFKAHNKSIEKKIKELLDEESL